jgi:gluconolactonase
MRILASGLEFPEGPIAMPDGTVILVEMARETLSRVMPDGRVEVVAEMPGGPNGAAVGPDGRIYVCNNGGFSWIRTEHTLRPSKQSPTYTGGSIDVVDPASGKVERLYDRCGSFPLLGPNDLVFDAHGGFWFTDPGKRRGRELDLGFVYWAKADGSEIREVVAGMITPNGIGLSPDGNTLYVVETITGRLYSWPIVAPGVVRTREWPAAYGATLVTGAGGSIRFDSLAVSERGNICVAALDSCAVLEIAPNDATLRRHPMPDMLVTNICFGGPDMRSAFVTLAHEGKLVVTDWHEPGLRLHHAPASIEPLRSADRDQ